MKVKATILPDGLEGIPYFIFDVTAEAWGLNSNAIDLPSGKKVKLEWSQFTIDDGQIGLEGKSIVLEEVI